MLYSFAAEIDSSYSSSRLKIVIVIVKKNYVMWKYFFWSFDRVCVVAKALSPNFSIVFLVENTARVNTEASELYENTWHCKSSSNTRDVQS